MSFDLYSQESDARIDSLPRVKAPPPGAFDNFLLGTGAVAMRGAASTGRAASLAFSAIPVGIDKLASITSGREITAAQDSFFADVHDPVFSRAVDYWTPKPGEVGAAAEIAGSVLSLLPLAIASPAAAVASVQLGTAEDLSNKGVSTGKAMAVGAVQAAGLGLGIWMPILGQNLWQRVLLGGAGFNVLQGAATRGASGAILQDTPAAGDYKAADGAAITLDLLMGMAFGGIAHVSPAMRAQGDAFWKKVENWTGTLKPSDVDAIMALRQAQHLNVDSAPGKPADLPDLDAHVTAMRQAIDDLVNDRPVNVEEIVAGAKFEPDAERVKFQRQMADELEKQVAEIAPPLKPESESAARIVEPSKTAQEAPQAATAEPATKAPTEPGSPEGGGKAQAAAPDPLASEAARFAGENPDLPIRIGEDAEGNPITKSAKQYLEDADNLVARANEDAKLFEIAAGCMLGIR